MNKINLVYSSIFLKLFLKYAFISLTYIHNYRQDLHMHFRFILISCFPINFVTRLNNGNLCIRHMSHIHTCGTYIHVSYTHMHKNKGVKILSSV